MEGTSHHLAPMVQLSQRNTLNDFMSISIKDEGILPWVSRKLKENGVAYFLSLSLPLSPKSRPRKAKALVPRLLYYVGVFSPRGYTCKN